MVNENRNLLHLQILIIADTLIAVAVHLRVNTIVQAAQVWRVNVALLPADILCRVAYVAVLFHVVAQDADRNDLYATITLKTQSL